MKPTSTTASTRPRSRYGTLRPFAPQILEWCAQGIDWPLIQARLAELGVTVRMGTLWGYAQRQGWMLIQPYSKHYDDVLDYRFSQGGLTVENLRQHAKQHTPKYTR
jgi:hypothetical protein